MLLYFAIAAAVIAPLAVAAVGKATAPLLDKHMLGLVTASTALGYLPFFVIGILLCAYPRLLDRFSRVTGWMAFLAAIAAVGVSLGAGREPVFWKALYVLSRSLLAWMAVRAVFWLFRSHLFNGALRPLPSAREERGFAT